MSLVIFRCAMHIKIYNSERDINKIFHNHPPILPLLKLSVKQRYIKIPYIFYLRIGKSSHSPEILAVRLRGLNIFMCEEGKRDKKWGAFNEIYVFISDDSIFGSRARHIYMTYIIIIWIHFVWNKRARRMWVIWINEFILWEYKYDLSLMEIPRAVRLFLILIFNFHWH